MTDLPTAFALAFAQLGDRRILAVLGKSLAVTLAVFGLFGVVAWQGLSETIHAYAANDNYAADYQQLAGLIAIVLTIIGGWLLFRVVALAVLQFFADDVVLAVEAKHYPQAASAARTLSFAEDSRNALGGVLRAVLVNLAALPFALVLLVTGIGTALLFWAVNGWLLGRELQDMAWLRHRHHADAKSPVGGTTRFMLGGIVAALMIVPFVNLLAPVLGAAAATHLVHRRKSATDAP